MGPGPGLRLGSSLRLFAAKLGRGEPVSAPSATPLPHFAAGDRKREAVPSQTDDADNQPPPPLVMKASGRPMA